MHIYSSKNNPQVLFVFLFFGLTSALSASSSAQIYSYDYFLKNIPSTNAIDSFMCIQKRKGYIKHNLQQELSSYTLTDKDYAIVGNNGFSNFDIREGYEDAPLSVR